jgi:opine dehydrogenase
MHKKITIMGASHGGQALAASLAMKGCQVRLFDHPDFRQNIDGINQNGGLVELIEKLSGSARIWLATTDIQSAMTGTEIIMIIVPSFAQKVMLELAAPYLRDGQTIVLLPGNYGSLEARNLLKKNNVSARVRIAETNTIPFACRIIEPGKVDILGVKTFMEIAALPSGDTASVIEDLRNFFPIPLEAAANVLAIGLANFNMIVHCPTTILNAAWVETTQGSFDFYGEGISPSIARVLEKIDEERRKIGKKLGIQLNPFVDWFKRAYPLDRQVETIFEVVHYSKIHSGRGSTAPKSLKERYVTEDIPYLMVPLASLGRLVNTPAKVTEMIISLASIMNETDYFAEGRNLERLGLSHLDLSQILAYVNQEVMVI